MSGCINPTSYTTPPKQEVGTGVPHDGRQPHDSGSIPLASSTPTQTAPATDIEAALNRFDEAAKAWGWEQDWGTGGQDTADCMAEYEASKADLLARIKAEHEQTKEDCADFVKHWLIESDNEYAVKVAVECSHALLEWDGKS